MTDSFMVAIHFILTIQRMMYLPDSDGPQLTAINNTLFLNLLVDRL